MKTKMISCVFVVVGMVTLIVGARAPEAKESGHQAGSNNPEPVFAKYDDYKWAKILPDLGDSSPEICILHVEPKTQATKLMIRTPKAIHIRKHWHSANETHTMIRGSALFACDGKKSELGAGSFNY